VSSTERHYTVLEVAELWHVDPSIVRNLFRDDPGVLKIGHGESRFKRGRVHLRIPESALQRVYAARCKKVA
jgi:hypothetical protein